MRSLLVALVAFGAGLYAGFVLFSKPDRSERVSGRAHAPESDFAARTPGSQQPAAHVSDPIAKEDASSAESEPARSRRGRPQQDPRTGKWAKHWAQEIQKRDAQIRDLERELEFLRRTLPRADILQVLEQASIKDLLGVATAVKQAATSQLLRIPDTVGAQYAALQDESAAGIARLLPRGKYDGLVNKRGGGAYYSFATRKNDYNAEPDIELQQGRYSTSFYGGTFGFLIDLGELALDSVPRGPTTVPGSVSAEAWRLLWEEIPADREGRRGYERRASKLRLRRSAKAVPNHAYLLRAVLPGEHDILVAFRNVHRDDHGHTLIFRELKRWDAAER